MENFYNAGGDSGSTGGGAGAGVGTVIAAVIGSATSYFGGKEQGRMNRDLQKQLAKLTLEQQKELEIRLQDSKSETERLALAYQFLAVQRNNESLNKIQAKRYTSYIVLGVGVTILALVFVKLAKR